MIKEKRGSDLEGSGCGAPMLLANELMGADVPTLLLGDMAHEEVLSRSSPLFSLLLSCRKLDDERLKLLVYAAAAKSNAVARSAASLLNDLLTSPSCPPELPETLLLALTSGVREYDEALVALLHSLAPVYAAAPAWAEKFISLLWQLLVLPDDEISPPARTALQEMVVALYDLSAVRRCGSVMWYLYCYYRK